MTLNTGRSRPAVARIRTAVPQLSARYLPRPRLSSFLDAVTDGEVALVSAPAGYGKTLLLADWVTRHRRVAWLTLDRDDNTDRRFWAGVLAALATVADIPAANPVRTLELPEVPSRSPTFLAALVDALAAVPGPLLLVFDDVHELTHQDPLAGLANLVENRPPGLRLVLASRSDPPLRLGRLRLTGELRELRAPALAFTAAEATDMLALAQVRLTPQQRGVLHAETAGWPAAMRLASLTLRDAADPDAFLSDLTGNGQAISDYLVGEILSRLPAEVTEVLLAVSVCDAVTAPLAVALAQRDDAADVLADLEHGTSLVASYGAGRRWFRVHPLLRAHLYADLRRRRPDLIAVLHQRMLDAYVAARNPLGALRHATLADDPAMVRAVLRGHGAVLATSGQHVEVSEALGVLDTAGLLRGDVELMLIGVLAHMELGRTDAADRLLAQVDGHWPAEPDSALAALRALATDRRSWYGPGRTTRTPPGAAPSTDQAELAVATMLQRANAALADGRWADADELARTAVEQGTGEGQDYLGARALMIRGIVAGLRGDISRMLKYSVLAGQTAPADAWSGTGSARFCLAMCAYGAFLQGRPFEALRYADAAQMIAGPDLAARDIAGQPSMPPSVQPSTRSLGEVEPVLPVVNAVRGAARFDLGEHQAGMAAMRAARGQVVEGTWLIRPVVALLALVEHDAALRVGLDANARTVQEWMQERADGGGDLTYIRAEAVAARIGSDPAAGETARVLLAPLLDGSLTPVMRWVPVAAWTLECVLGLRAGNRPRARDALHHALALAERCGVLRPLVVAPADVLDLLCHEVGNLGGADEVAQDVLAARRALDGHRLAGSGAAGSGAPTLTARETAVLDLLPGPLSLEEIAAQLAVTTNTVKTHLAAIYTKLGVRSRREAVARGRILIRSTR
ncbi:MAG TPA: LuxR C-terminal-related transcriptional regulator [Pseudonocardia sp.]